MSFSNADQFYHEVCLDIDSDISLDRAIKKNISKYRYSVSSDNRIVFEDGSECFWQDVPVMDGAKALKIDNSHRRFG